MAEGAPVSPTLTESVVEGRLLTERAEPVVEGDHDHVAPGGEHMSRKQIGGAVCELAAVNVEQHGVLVPDVTGDLATTTLPLSHQAHYMDRLKA